VATTDNPDHLYACWYPVGSPEFEAKDAELQAAGVVPVSVGEAT
jgi:hypothetical protein